MPYSDGALARTTAAADVAAAAYTYFDCLFAGVEPDIALIVADETDWSSRQPYGLPFFNDDAGQIRPGVVVMPAGSGDFSSAIVQDLRDASPAVTRSCPRHTRTAQVAWTCSRSSISSQSTSWATHLTLGDLRLPASWLSEIFVNLLITPDSAGNVVGIDPHKRTLTATIVDPRGGILASEHFRVSGDGHRALEAWAESSADRALGSRGRLQLGAPYSDVLVRPRR